MRVAFVVQGRTVSVNGTYRRRGGFGLLKTDEAATFQRTIAFRAKAAMRRQRGVVSAPVGITIAFFAASPAMDIDGPLKLVLDALEGIAYANDRQVVELAVRKQVDREHPRLAIEIYTLDPVTQEPAEELTA